MKAYTTNKLTDKRPVLYSAVAAKHKELMVMLNIGLRGFAPTTNVMNLILSANAPITGITLRATHRLTRRKVVRKESKFYEKR